MFDRFRSAPLDIPKYRIEPNTRSSYYRWSVVHPDGSKENFETKMFADRRRRELERHAKKEAKRKA